MRNWILVVFNLFFFLLEQTSGDDNDPRLKGRNCVVFFEELKRKKERERGRERDREKEKGREGELQRKRQRRKVSAREGHKETERKAP